MPIVTKEIIKDRLQAGGLRRVQFRFTDHLGGVHEPAVRRFPGNADLVAEMDAHALTVENSLPEIENVKGLFADDVLAYVLNPKHSTSKEIAKRLIREMMRERSPEFVLKLEPLINYLRANYTPAQLINFLDITTEQAQRMNQKINAILNSKADLETANSLVEDFD